MVINTLQIHIIGNSQIVFLGNQKIEQLLLVNKVNILQFFCSKSCNNFGFNYRKTKDSTGRLSFTWQTLFLLKMAGDLV